MDDLGKAMSDQSGELCMLGGGNPAHIKEVQDVFRAEMESILETPGAFEAMLGNYDSTLGYTEFRVALAELMNKHYKWNITEKNIILTNGSQSAFFSLFNLFAGSSDKNQIKKVLFPLTPEYIGYADQGLSDDMFISTKPLIEEIGENMFKYKVDFENLNLNDEVGAMCVSRPTNPTGNVLSDEEIKELISLAEKRDIPLIIDNAYGLPFPGIIFDHANLFWSKNCIYVMSLSKLGLPASRTGIVIADEEVVQCMSEMNGVMSLAPTGIGARLMTSITQSGRVLELSETIVKPYYQKKCEQALAYLKTYCKDIPYRVHKPEGALFLWIWFPTLKIKSYELYEKLKESGVLVVSGHYFFIDIEDTWEHKHQCIRITYSMDEKTVEKGIKTIGETVRKVS